MCQLQIWIGVHPWRNMPFRHVEADAKPSKKSKKGGAKGSVAFLKESTQLGCVYQDSYPRKSIPRKKTKIGIKNRERKGPSRGVIQKCETQERNPCAPRLAERIQDETKQTDAPAEWHGIYVSSSLKRRTKLRFTLLLKPGKSGRSLQRNEKSWLTPGHQCTC